MIACSAQQVHIVRLLARHPLIDVNLRAEVRRTNKVQYKLLLVDMSAFI